MDPIDAVAGQPRVSLESFDRLIEIDARTDRRYLLPTDDAGEALAAVDPDVSLLEIDGSSEFAYESIYFDTPELDLHRAAAQRRRRRFKVRTRHYVDSGLVMVELKLKTARGQTAKLRQPTRVHGRLDAEAMAFLRTHVGDHPVLPLLEPSLTTAYRRISLSASDGRITHDRFVRATSPDGRVVEVPGSVLETKTQGRPSALDRELWRRRRRPVRFSKYGTLLAVLHPRLPHNKWHRTAKGLEAQAA